MIALLQSMCSRKCGFSFFDKMSPGTLICNFKINIITSANAPLYFVIFLPLIFRMGIYTRKDATTNDIGYAIVAREWVLLARKNKHEGKIKQIKFRRSEHLKFLSSTVSLVRSIMPITVTSSPYNLLLQLLLNVSEYYVCWRRVFDGA